LARAQACWRSFNSSSSDKGGTINDANYQGSATTALVINPAALTIAAAANAKTYDGTTSAAAVPTVMGLRGFDPVTALAESYDTKNIGTGKTLGVSAYTVNDGCDQQHECRPAWLLPGGIAINNTTTCFKTIIEAIGGCAGRWMKIRRPAN
jgi:hypothetical protein